MEKLGVNSILFLIAFSIALGVFARTATFVRCDPIGVDGDLLGVWQVWDDLTAEELTEGPSVRINQFGFAIILGVVAAMFDCDIAHSAKYIAFVCSLGIIFTAGLLVYALRGNLWEAGLASAVVAIANGVIASTLAAQSESLFILVVTGGSAFALFFWHSGKWRYVAPATALLALACATRGTGLFHVVGLAGTFTFAWLVQRRSQNISGWRLAKVLGVLLLAAGFFFAARAVVVNTTLQRYVDRDGKVPKIPSYVTYAIWDGLKLGPYGVSDPKKMAERQRAKKAVDPATGAIRSYASVHGDSALTLIWENLAVYVRHYVVGVSMTAVKLISTRQLTIAGTVPLVMGLIVLLVQRRTLVLSFILGWVSVYLFVVPGLSLHDRIVWPACFALVLPSVLLITTIARAFTCHWESKPRWVAGGFVALTMLSGIVMARDIAGAAVIPRVTANIHRVASEAMPSLNGEPIVVLSSTAASCAFGTFNSRFLQMPYNDEPEVQYEYLRKHRPDYIYFYAPYERQYRGPFAALKTVLMRHNDDLAGALVWKYDRNEVWKLHYTGQTRS